MAMGGWLFRDFLSTSRNEINDWLHKQPDAARAHIDDHIMMLMLSNTDSLTRQDGVGQLHGRCRGLIELVVPFDRVQYRPIGAYGPRRKEITLLIGATERDGRLVPRNACETAQKRMTLVKSDVERYSCEHDVS